MNTNQQMADYYQALADGKTLQFKSRERWEDKDYGNLIYKADYRIKPEPEVIYVNQPKGCWKENASIYSKESTALEAGKTPLINFEYIAKRFVEDQG